MLVREMATSSALRLFEGDIETGPLLPVYSHNAVIHGYFRLFGKVIAHSVLQEGPAFPCLPEAMYQYLVEGEVDKAVPFLTVKDLPPHGICSCPAGWLVIYVMVYGNLEC